MDQTLSEATEHTSSSETAENTSRYKHFANQVLRTHEGRDPLRNQAIEDYQILTILQIYRPKR
ncbi:hypothetical protein DPMN_111124 [Dreissena polymorpha]|uniref:PARP catalytic domain-containing protein n=1 Tax=Dreissena polymorpha TaxID=45954 RepID=A0A9D4KDV2_DREPO|nr:hypothetical protein DPMN_111124 [Dreissena polymorpha]